MQEEADCVEVYLCTGKYSSWWGDEDVMRFTGIVNEAHFKPKLFYLYECDSLAPSKEYANQAPLKLSDEHDHC